MLASVLVGFFWCGLKQRAEDAIAPKPKREREREREKSRYLFLLLTLLLLLDTHRCNYIMPLTLPAHRCSLRPANNKTED